jgi:DNA-binding CsgD family transcriptional regulator
MSFVVDTTTTVPGPTFLELSNSPFPLDPTALIQVVETFMDHPRPISATFCAHFATITQHRAQLYLAPHTVRASPHTILLPVTFAQRSFGQVVVPTATWPPTALALLQNFTHLCASLLFSIEQQVLLTSLQPLPTNRIAEPLTRREEEILTGLATGSSEVALQHQLQVRPKTLSKHLEHIRGKLQVHTHMDMLIVAYQHALVAFLH